MQLYINILFFVDPLYINILFFVAKPTFTWSSLAIVGKFVIGIISEINLIKSTLFHFSWQAILVIKLTESTICIWLSHVTFTTRINQFVMFIFGAIYNSHILPD